MRIGLNTSIVGGSLINPFAAYNIGGQTPQTIADFEEDKYASANKNLGPELVTNGTFDSDLSGWTDASNGTALVEWVDGKASLDDSQGGSAVGKPKLKQTVTGNGVFLLTFETEADSIFIIQNETDGYFFSSTSGTSRSVVVLSQTTSWSLSFQLENPNVARTIDNVSLREIVSYSPASTTAESLLTHTRAGTATYTDSTGTLQTAASGELRKDNHIWGGSSWVKRCLVEPQSTNLVTYSEYLSNAAWTKGGGVTIGTPVTRNGISLDLIENDGTGNFKNVTQSVGSVADGAYLTFSCFIEAGTSTETAIRVDDIVNGASSNRVTVPITWTSGVPSLQSDVTLGLTFVGASLQDFGDGVYRVHLTVLNGTGGALTLHPKYYVQWDDTAAAVNTYAGGFQAEIGPTPSSYIPTTSAQVTRPADALSIDSTLLPYDSTAMTIALEGEMTYADNDLPVEAEFCRWENDASNAIRSFLRTNSTNTGRVEFRQLESGTTDSVTSAEDAYSPGINVPFNFASRHTSSDLNGAVDGTALTANTTVTALPDLSATDFQIAYTGVINIKSLRILGGYGATDAELEAATT
jgi:hypothetical protein